MTIEQLEQLKAQGRKKTAVVLAACSLACRRRGYKERQRVRRVYTGRLAGRRAFRGEAVILPDNSVGFVFGIRRGMAAIWKDAPLTVGEREYAVVNTDALRRYKLPSAALLGAQKAGRKEQPSQRKREACRRNGRRPCHPGRRRGRPKKAASTKVKGDAVNTSKPTNDRPPPAGDYAAWVAYYSQNRAGQSH